MQLYLAVHRCNTTQIQFVKKIAVIQVNEQRVHLQKQIARLWFFFFFMSISTPAQASSRTLAEMHLRPPSPFSDTWACHCNMTHTFIWQCFLQNLSVGGSGDHPQVKKKKKNVFCSILKDKIIFWIGTFVVKNKTNKNQGNRSF